MSHAVADCFQVKERGYIREGYFADLVIVDLNQSTKVSKGKYFIQMRLESVGGFWISRIHYIILLLMGNLVYGNGSMG